MVQNPLQQRTPRLRTVLSRVLERWFENDPVAPGLCAEFLSHETYDRNFVTTLFSVCTGSSGLSWNMRLFATLMLANQCLLLGPDRRDEFTFLFWKLGILSRGKARMDERVLREGYTSVEFELFTSQFLRNLGRARRIHRNIQGLRTTPRALDQFIRFSREPSKLWLARYLFTPAEVVEQVSNELSLSAGLVSPLEDEATREAARYLSTLPEYEKEIFRQLSAQARVYWTCEKTSSEINSLVENPIRTVACVIKPPGSSIELELKRSGLRAGFPLTVSFTYDTGESLPPSHRLQGGASTASLRWESNQAAAISEIYRAAHGREAPISKLLSLSAYRTVPYKGEEVHLLEYFTDPDVFGDAYDNMREHMERCVSSFDEQYGDELAHLPGAVGLTGRFLAHALPCQGIFAQTSSHRLDMLANYLSPTGADAYFLRGLKRNSYSKYEAKLFVDSLLDELLGTYIPPKSGYRTHTQYISAAFQIAENRIRADRFHALAVTELGTFWGTLLAIGAYSFGESFVGRNLGLKSSFEAGDWTVKLLFMDHDNLRLPERGEQSFWPHAAYRASVVDECYICANPDRPLQVDGSSLWYLQQIYQVDTPTRSQSKVYLHRAMERAYKQTRASMDNNPKVQRFFSKSYIRHMHDWDIITADYLTSCRNANDFTSWKNRATTYLMTNKYKKEVIDNYIMGVEKHYDVLTRYSFLYLPCQAGTTNMIAASGISSQS
jgi:hypothetical protein